jgi:lipopolysaccharide export system protein LptA
VEQDGNQLEARQRAIEAHERAMGGDPAPAKRAPAQPQKRPVWWPRWQRVARFVLAIGLTGFAAVVFLRVQQRVEPVAARVVDRLDPDAVIESTGVELVRTAGGEENFSLTGNRQLTFEDGSMRFFEGMSLKVTEQLDRESFIVTGIEASMDDAQTEFTVSGDVQLTVSDGLVVRTGALAYARGQSLVTMEDGPAQTTFSRSGLEASGRNPAYDRDRAITNLPEAARVRLTGDGDREAVDIESARATLAHDDRYMRFEGGTTAATGPLVLESDNMTAHFGEEETALERIELRGRADIHTIKPTAGGLRAMRAANMTLKFESTSRVLERVLLAGKAAIELVGTDGSRGARISAVTMDSTLAADGGDVTALEAWDAVRLQLPETPDGARQEIRAGRLAPDGPPGSEMTAVRFEQDVVYQERRAAAGSAAANRVIRADRLEASVKKGLSALVVARFLGHVSFEDDRRAATASEVVYDVTGGLVTLSRVSDASLTPSVTDTTSRIEAGIITLAVDGSMLEASGGVTSVLTPEGAGDDDSAESTSKKVPALLDEDQQMLVSAGALRYDADIGQTTYTGQAHLWQGTTSFEGDTLLINDETGNLTASGNVRTRIQLMRLNETTQRSEASSTRVEANTLVYDNVTRHAVYDTKALLRSERGNLKADTIEIFMATDDRTLDRLEATGNVTLGLDGRWATGDHLVYYEAEGRYEMEGGLVKIVEEVKPVETTTRTSTQPDATPRSPSCSSTTGRTLAFFRSTDTVTVDGREVARTQTRSGTCTPPTF